MQERVIKPLFVKGPSIGARIVSLCVLSIALIFASHRLDVLDDVRAGLMSVATPFYWITDLPARISNWGERSAISRESLLDENSSLRAEQLVMQAKLQKLASLATENVRLRELLNSTALVQENVLVAEIIGISPEPLSHHVLVNKGKREGVYVGQPVIDAYGLFGQVIEVSPFSSRVMLITDSTHALPVQVNRNGVRAIAEGVGLLHELELPHVAATTDIKEGDILVSSGLGGVFPIGYPVATVTSIVHDPGQAFIEVKAAPKAHLNRSRHVLLVFKGKPLLADDSKAADERVLPADG